MRLHAKSIPRDYRGMPAVTRPQKITFGEMREAGVRGLLIYCSDYKCSHSIAINADQCPDDVRLSDLEARFVCKACGKRGADIRPDFHWNKPPVAATIVSVLVAPLRRTDQAARCVSLPAHVPAPARTTTNATKSAASIDDRVQLVGIVDNSGT